MWRDLKGRGKIRRLGESYKERKDKGRNEGTKPRGDLCRVESRE